MGRMDYKPLSESGGGDKIKPAKAGLVFAFLWSISNGPLRVF